MKKRILIITKVLLIWFSSNGLYAQNWDEIIKAVASDRGAWDEFGYSVAISGDYAIVGTRREDEDATGGNTLSDAGSAYIFKNNLGTWTEVQKLVATDREADDFFGYSVAIMGDYAIVGAMFEDEDATGGNALSNSGSAYIFKNNAGIWSQAQKIVASDRRNGVFFGNSVAISGDYAIVGAFGDNLDATGGNSINGAGSAYIFKNNGGTWSQVQKIVASDRGFADEFGYSVAISGDYAIVGAYKEDEDEIGGNTLSSAGSAYIFKNTSGTWSQVQKLVASDRWGYDNFGNSVAISGDYAIVGAYFEDEDATGGNLLIDAGSAYIFKNNGGTWSQVQKMVASDRGAGDRFGSSVAISGDYAIVGAYLEDEDVTGGNTITNAGSAYIFKNNTGTWSQVQKMVASDRGVSDGFGYQVAISGDYAIVSAYWEDEDATGGNTLNDAGSAYIFKAFPGVFGFIHHDFDENCIKGNTEGGLANRKAIISPGNIIVETNQSGIWNIDSLPTGTYTITVDTSGHWNPTCPVTQSFTVVYPDSLTLAPNVGFVSTMPCAEPNIAVLMPFIRRCFSNQNIYVEACNTNLATGVLSNAYVELELDSLLTLDSAMLAYTNLGDNRYRFDVGTLNPGQCNNFWIATTISCDAIPLQTLCMKANLFPADSCVFDTIPNPPVGGVSPCTLPWDKSSLSVNGWCQNDSIYFTITNTGDFGNGDMQCYAPVRIYIDGVYTILDSVLLVGGQTYTYVFAGDGKTWRLEADQHPLHPGNSHPNATVELCGNPSNWTPNLVNILPMDDADPVVDIYCGVVTGSYDPNDKTGYPLGVGTDHIVTPNGKLDYVIRFQNTGTDTAFTVVVRDTLDIDLDIFSVRSGVSSHNYTFKMFGPRVMEWTFNNIMLPDSSTDQEGSNGFITFTVLQNPNLPDGTEINNRVGIYFDFNDAIITNTTSHIIGRQFDLPVSIQGTAQIYNGIQIYPNPTGSQLNLILNETEPLTIEIYSLEGKLINRTNATQNMSLNVSNYPKGMYFITATNKTGKIYQSKFIKE